MGTFGWSYPAGAEYDPSAPYNQDYSNAVYCADCHSDLEDFETICEHCKHELEPELCVWSYVSCESKGYIVPDANSVRVAMNEPERMESDAVRLLCLAGF